MPFMKDFLFPREHDKDTIALILMSLTANLFGAGKQRNCLFAKSDGSAWTVAERAQRDCKQYHVYVHSRFYVNDPVSTRYNS